MSLTFNITIGWITVPSVDGNYKQSLIEATTGFTTDSLNDITSTRLLIYDSNASCTPPYKDSPSRLSLYPPSCHGVTLTILTASLPG